MAYWADLVNYCGSNAYLNLL